ncbi:MAG: flagellar biosynthesis anti-sigma factor FlgM [Planctomycetaceae bacterium]|nr:flagellar biosynthesis anti-sigma factor FlgM [Planctomycetaceae bacterium]
MNISGPGSIQNGFSIERLQQATKKMETVSTPKTMAPVDQVEISELGKMMSQSPESSDIREARLAQIKAEIDAGTYDTPEKLEVALMKMIGQLDLEG